MAWFLAPSLVQLRNEINEKWPNRSKIHDGTIGDAAHSSRTSQHNPDSTGAVTAMDITRTGINAAAVLAELIGDPRVWYVIHRGQIWSRTNGWTAKKYTGANKHNEHIHVSLNQNSRSKNDKTPWLAKSSVINPKPVDPDEPEVTVSSVNKPGTRTLRVGSKGKDVEFLQRFISGKLMPDGEFGVVTEKAVKVYQKMRGLTADGIVGNSTWKSMGVID